MYCTRTQYNYIRIINIIGIQLHFYTHVFIYIIYYLIYIKIILYILFYTFYTFSV